MARVTDVGGYLDIDSTTAGEGVSFYHVIQYSNTDDHDRLRIRNKGLKDTSSAGL